LLIVTAALARPSAALSPVLSPELAEDYEADRVLDRAVEFLGPDQVSWLSCTIQQQVDLPGVHYQSEGRYLLAPGHRSRLEIQTRGTGLGGTLLWVSDGTTAWQAVRAGSGPWEKVTRLNLQDAFAVIGGTKAPACLRAEFFNGPTFGGVGPLLYTLRTRLMWIHHERQGGDPGILALTGVWPAPTLRELAPADRPWPTGLPRYCRINLDGRSLWPYAIEWWGPDTLGVEVLLARTKFHDPQFNRPFAPDLLEHSFNFDPGDVPVTDRTSQVATDLAARGTQFQGEPAAR
jgi:hypothetical protein